MRQRCLNTASRTDRTGRSTDVPPDRYITSHGEGAHGVLAVENDDKVGDISAYLEAPS